ncbi:MAG: OadG family protein [Desulfococcaceae bacterium]
MTGLEAIAANNGWAIAGLGICIVFSGLALLSLIISQLHKVLALLEDPGRRLREFRRRGKRTEPPEPEKVACPVIPSEIKESVRQYRMLVDRLGQPFSLPRLLFDAEGCGLDHPHSALNDLIRNGLIIPNGVGFYQWNERVSAATPSRELNKPR